MSQDFNLQVGIDLAKPGADKTVLWPEFDENVQVGNWFYRDLDDDPQVIQEAIEDDIAKYIPNSHRHKVKLIERQVNGVETLAWKYTP